MANNIDVKDAAAATVTMKTTDNAGVHTAHHNVDSSALPTGAATETTLAAISASVDGLEALATTLNGYVDGIEGLLGGTLVVSSTNLDIRDLTSASDSVAAVQSGTWNITNVSGTVSLPTGAATETTLASALTSLQTIDNIVSGSGVNVSQIGGSAARTGDLDTGAGTDTYPIIGLAVGADGGGVPVTDAAPLPVYLPFETAVTIETANNALAVYGNAVEDSVASSGQSLFGSGFVRDDALTTLTPVDGDWTQGRVDSTGALWTRVTSIGSALPAGTNNIGDVDIASIPAATSGGAANVSSSATTVTLLASNASRKGFTIYNDSTQILYLKFGAIASSTSFHVKMVADSYYESPAGFIYTGVIDGIWASANGAARVGEFT